MRLLLIGPLPPPIGGTTVLFHLLMEEVSGAREFETEVIDFVRGGEARTVIRLLRRWWDVARLPLAVIRSDVVSLHGSNRRIVAWGACLQVLCKLFRRPLIVRVFGGSLDRYYAAASPIERIGFAAVFRADRVLLESKHLVRFFTEVFPMAQCVWFPNSRRIVGGGLTILNAHSRNRATKFVFLGQVKRSKGIEDIVAAASLIRSSEPVIVDVFGPLGFDVGVDQIDADGRVRYCGVLPPGDVERRLREYDVLLLPTWYDGEGYPGVIIEAFAAGVPVIASDWRAIPELVSDGVSGLLIRPRDPHDLARAMERVNSEEGLLERLRGGAVNHALRFSSEHWNGKEFPKICRELH